MPSPFRETPTPAPSPLATLLLAYDLAIDACRARNAGAAYRHIATLRAAHPCDTPTALGIDAIYASCERAVRGGDYVGAARTLEQLRGAWQTADRLTALDDPRVGRHADRHLNDDRYPVAVVSA